MAQSFRYDEDSSQPQALSIPDLEGEMWMSSEFRQRAMINIQALAFPELYLRW